MIAFVDETGENPLPPGVYAQVYLGAGAPVPDNLVASGYTNLGGTIAFTPQGAVAYVATFTGPEIPPSTQIGFFGSANPAITTTIPIVGFRSPNLSTSGYRDEFLALFPLRWAGDAARAQGGTVFAAASAIGSMLGTLDTASQSIRAGLRLPTCSGAQIDSWAYDFFGSYLLRYADEPDAIYYSRILAAFGPRCTLAAIQQIVQQFFVATALATQLQETPNLAYDITGSFDMRGGFDVSVLPPSISSLIPVVNVWDAQSNPSGATLYSVTVPEFVINVGFSGTSAAWYLDHSYLSIDTLLIDTNTVTTSTTPPDPRLGALVNLVKAAGTKPLYQTELI